jgi:hypothetical protein
MKGLRTAWFEAAEGVVGRELVMPASTRLLTAFHRLTYWA